MRKDDLERWLAIKFWKYIAMSLVVVSLYWGISHINWIVFNQLGILPMPIWPAAAVALISGILYGWKAAPGVAIGTILANRFSLGAPIAFACLIAVMNTLGPIISAKLIRKSLGDSLRIRCLNDIIVIFILGVLLAPILTASGGIGFKWVVGLIPPDQMFIAWMKWAFAHAFGTLVFGLPVLAYLLTREASE